MHASLKVSILFVLLIAQLITANDQKLLEAQKVWSERHLGATDGQAEGARALASIVAWKSAVSSDTTDPARFDALLQAHFFHSYFCDSLRTDRLGAARQGLADSEIGLRRFPNHPGVLAWTAMLWARFAELAGVFEVARSGAADQVRDMALRSVNANPNYGNGIALRMLGVLHAEAPYIPFILTWPSNKKADAFFQKALRMAPDNGLTLYMYGDFLHRIGKHAEALRYYEKALGIPMDPKHPTEDALFRKRILARLSEMRQS